MDTKDGKTANDIAALAETLADRIEAAIAEPDRGAEYEVAALLLGDGARVHTMRKGNADDVVGRIVVDHNGNPFAIMSPWAGAHRGVLRKDFASSVSLAINLAERLFEGWGWDVIKWPKGQGGVPAGAKLVDGVPEALPENAFVYDAEVTPPEALAKAASGRSLIGQHTTAGGALLAAILRGYAFKVKHEAGMLAPPIEFDLTDQERGYVEDIVDRAEDLALSPPEARIDRMMDIAAVHKNGCPLDLESFLHHATDFAFKHDFLGIVENVDRSTGKLGNHFLPKYAQAETDRIIAETDKAVAESTAPPAIGVDNGAVEEPKSED